MSLEEALACRCRGVGRPKPCMKLLDQDPGVMFSPATQEDGLCDVCRCPHGCCEDHTSFDEHYACHRARRGAVLA